MTDSIIYINFVNYEKNFYLNIVKNIQHYNRLNNFLYLIPGKYEYMFFINGINIFFNNNKARIIKNYFVTFSFFDLSVNFYIICNNNILSIIIKNFNRKYIINPDKEYNNYVSRKRKINFDENISLKLI
jgi:hypothetical protein